MSKRTKFKSLKPELVYLMGDVIVPAKTISYVVDPQTGKPIDIRRSKTHKFETKLKNDLKFELEGIDTFPTRSEVFVSITHGIHAKTKYEECDLDNRAKTILDALGGVVYLDDSQVKMLWTYKEFLKDSQESYCRIAVKILSDTTVQKILNHIEPLMST